MLKKKLAKRGEAMASLPEDIYLEILLRLPVNSTYVCKCVCKSWFQIISNPSFGNMHLNIAIRRKNCNLIFESFNSKRRTVKSASSDSLLSLNVSESEMVELVDYPFGSGCNHRLLGSCNGLVCLCYFSSKIAICIFNPATKEYKSIPISEHRYWNYSYCYFHMNNAFGYDCKSGDYKLINIVEEDGTELLDVYTLGSDSWECSQILHYAFPDKGQTGILHNGAFHWIGKARGKNSSRLIISMDISDMKLEEVQLPQEHSEKKHLWATIGVLEGCLCLLIRICSACSEVWMMQDYGIPESWTRVYNIDDGSISRSGAFTGYTLRLLQSFENGQILLKYGFRLVVYDPKHSRGREPENFISLWLNEAISYVESLVSLNSGTYAGRNLMVETCMKI